jgi:hypothetical protein
MSFNFIKPQKPPLPYYLLFLFCEDAFLPTLISTVVSRILRLALETYHSQDFIGTLSRVSQVPTGERRLINGLIVSGLGRPLSILDEHFATLAPKNPRALIAHLKQRLRQGQADSSVLKRASSLPAKAPRKLIFPTLLAPTRPTNFYLGKEAAGRFRSSSDQEP